jgi:LPXTG-motif cell wall-anchored protein
MKSRRIVTSVKTVLYFIVFMAVIASCNNEQGMMHGGHGSMNMGNWNWVLILLGIIIVFLLGYLVARKRK